MTLRATRAEWSRGQRLKNDLLWVAANVGLGCIRLLPRRSLALLGTMLGTVAYLGLPRERSRAHANLGRVYPDLAPTERRRMTLAIFRTLGTNLTDTLALLRENEVPDATLRLPSGSATTLRRLLERKQGLVYVTAHLGPWERMAALLCSKGFPITTVARESYDSRFHGLLYDPIRKRRGTRAIYRGDPSAPFAILRSLRAGRIVGFPVDLPGRVPVAPVRLLGQPSVLPIGPARIALRTGSPIVVGTPGPADSPLGPPGLVVRIDELDASDLAPTPLGEARLLQRIADALSERIRALPLHWPWMHPSFSPPQERANCGRMA